MDEADEAKRTTTKVNEAKSQRRVNNANKLKLALDEEEIPEDIEGPMYASALHRPSLDAQSRAAETRSVSFCYKCPSTSRQVITCVRCDLATSTGQHHLDTFVFAG